MEDDNIWNKNMFIGISETNKNVSTCWDRKFIWTKGESPNN